jgi:hypothetical protein
MLHDKVAIERMINQNIEDIVEELLGKGQQSSVKLTRQQQLIPYIHALNDMH